MNHLTFKTNKFFLNGDFNISETDQEQIDQLSALNFTILNDVTCSTREVKPTCSKIDLNFSQIFTNLTAQMSKTAISDH